MLTTKMKRKYLMILKESVKKIKTYVATRHTNRILVKSFVQNIRVVKVTEDVNLMFY